MEESFQSAKSPQTYAVSFGGFPSRGRLVVVGRRVAAAAAATAIDGVELREAGDGEEDVQLAGAALEVEPQVVGQVALQGGQIKGASETWAKNPVT